MKPKNTLEQINDEGKINAVISHDEESAAKDTGMALEMAEALILQLPQDLQGRDEWLTKFGQSPEAHNLRRKKPVNRNG